MKPTNVQNIGLVKVNIGLPNIPIPTTLFHWNHFCIQIQILYIPQLSC